MKRTLVIIVAIVVVTGWLVRSAYSVPENSPTAAPKQHIVVHLSHFTDDLHRCFMALKVAGLAQEHGAQVTIFLDLEGVRLAQRRYALDLTWGSDSKQLGELYDEFVDGGGKVVLCPHCAKSARAGDLGLRRNAAIGTMPELGKMLMEADKIMDY